jgi:hypothetical protein
MLNLEKIHITETHMYLFFLNLHKYLFGVCISVRDGNHTQ